MLRPERTVLHEIMPKVFTELGSPIEERLPHRPGTGRWAHLSMAAHSSDVGAPHASEFGRLRE